MALRGGSMHYPASELLRIHLPRTPVNRGKTESQSLGFLPFQIAGRCALTARAALGRLINGTKGEFVQSRGEGALQRQGRKVAYT